MLQLLTYICKSLDYIKYQPAILDEEQRLVQSLESMKLA